MLRSVETSFQLLSDRALIIYNAVVDAAGENQLLLATRPELIGAYRNVVQKGALALPGLDGKYVAGEIQQYQVQLMRRRRTLMRSSSSLVVVDVDEPCDACAGADTSPRPFPVCGRLPLSSNQIGNLGVMREI